MFEIMNYEEIENNFTKEEYILIDVRSPGEYDLETIPDAINLPIFSDKEREIVGTVYKEDLSETAKKLGIKFVSEKLPMLYEKISQLNKKYENLVFFCARGGYRSSSIVSLLDSIGVPTIKLDNGYKGYRNHINEALPIIIKNLKLIVLYGNTGVGKTEILKHLEDQKMNILDLEDAANHRGSTLGSVGLGKQTTQKMFESLIYKALKKRKGNLVFVEGESRRIGKDVIPKYIFNAMKKGIHIKIEASLEYRVETILKDYVHGTDEELIDSLNHLRKHLGNKKIDFYINSIKKSNYKRVIEDLMLNYYDPLYEKNTRNFVKTFYNEDHKDTAKDIVHWVNLNLINNALD
ncbi:MAG TPA: tRNA 2-selenouridine(34) synthase MnmH [Tissierellaceae bacterium]|nr:tRNA 2-selenouridine(34) synthase MnmH [Tissierellaceae bacterium]